MGTPSSDGLKLAEIHQGHHLVRATFHLSSCWTQCTVEEELRARIPHQTVPLQVEVGLDVEGFHRVLIVGVRRQ